MEDFKKNPLRANPFLVITCFDELVRTKGIALVRGDVIGQLNKEEAGTVLEQLFSSYLVESKFLRVKEFNHTPQQFKVEEYTQESLVDFKKVQEEVRAKTPKQKDIGKHRP